MRWTLALCAAAMLSCSSQPEAPEAPAGATRAPAPEVTPDNEYDALRQAEDRALLEHLVGTSDLGDARLRAAHDLGTMRMVILERDGTPQTVSVVELLPPEDLSDADLQAAFDERRGEPLELLGYDSVTVLNSDTRPMGGRDASWARIDWTRTDVEKPERGAGSVAWVRCDGSERWLFVSEEIGSEHFAEGAWADVVGRFQLCSTN